MMVCITRGRQAYDLLAADLAENGVGVTAVQAALKKQSIRTHNWGNQ